MPPRYQEDFLPLALRHARYEAPHRTSPFCWLETPRGRVAHAGRDRLCEWAAEAFAYDDLSNDRAAKEAIVRLANAEPWKPPLSLVAFHVPKPGLSGSLT